MKVLLKAIVPLSKGISQGASLFFGIPWIILLTWLLVNGESIFPEVWDSSWTSLVSIYIILDAAFLGMYANMKIQNKNSMFSAANNSLGMTLFFGVLAFVITWITMIIIYAFYPYVSNIPIQSAFIAAFLLQVVVIAASEEVIFRGLILDMLSTKLRFVPAVIISSIAFALFHYTAYGGPVGFMVVAFCLGVIWCYVRMYWGLGATIFSHAAYNLAVQGIIVFPMVANILINL